MLNYEYLLQGGIHRLSHVYRYSSLPTLRKENVSEHTFYVALYAMFIARDVEQLALADPDISVRAVVDYAKLLSRALLHDLDESHTGDFLRVVKYGHPQLKSILDELATSLVGKIQSELGIDFMSTWKNAKDGDLEGLIVEIADFARVVSYVLEETQSGNSHLGRILPEVRVYLEKLKDSPKWDEKTRKLCSSPITSILDVIDKEQPCEY